MPPHIGGIPLYGQTVQSIVTLIENPCDEPWTVYLETALEPAGELALGLLSFGIGDILRGYARPKMLRGGHLGRRKRARTRVGRLARRAHIPEIGNQIGRHLPGTSFFQARTVGRAEQALWAIDGVVQRQLLYWLVADLLGDFYINWNSALNKTIVCAREADWRIQYDGTGGSAAAITGWTSLDAPNLIYGGQFPGHGVASQTLPDAFCVILLELHAKNTWTEPQTLELGISRGAAPNEFIALSGPTTVEPGATGQQLLSWRGRGPFTAGFHWRINPGFATGTYASHTIFVRFDGA